MNDKLRDSMPFLYKQPHNTFEERLADSMLAEKECIHHGGGHAKVAACQLSTPTPENAALGMDAIQNQVEVINQYLKGANTKGVPPKPPNPDVQQHSKCHQLLLSGETQYQSKPELLPG